MMWQRVPKISEALTVIEEAFTELSESNATFQPVQISTLRSPKRPICLYGDHCLAQLGIHPG